MFKMISIANYLRENGKAEAAGVTDPSPESLFINELLERMEQQVLCGNPFEDLRLQLAALRQDLPRNLAQADFSSVRTRLTEILGAYQQQLSTLSVASTLEMQKIVTMLNGTLQVLAAGSERSVSRLKEIEVSLVGASKIDDIVALKARLTDCLAFVRKETVRDREELSRTLAAIEEDFRKAQEVLLFRSQGTPGRREGEQFLAQLASRQPGEREWFVAAFSIRHFELVAKRYGQSVADQLVLELICQRLQPFVQAGSVFRWTRDSFLIVIQRNGHLTGLQRELHEAVASPLDYKTQVGNRTAVLTISCKWAAWAGVDVVFDDLVAKIDSFTGSGDGHSSD